jgi:tRNA A-37 threonylcarbamoyl transferase component Bud32
MPMSNPAEDRRGEQSTEQESVPPAPADDTNGSATLVRSTVSPLDDPYAKTPLAPGEPLRSVAPPGYEILGELGRGGMGVVYKARQEKLKRIVALKMILSGSHAGVDERVRFLAEAEAIAAIAHPSIVQIHEFGTHEDLPFFAMEFCAGGSLASKLAGTPLPAQESAQLIEQCARAIQAAHERGIIHRDLKPGNVLLSEDGKPRITDFGLARRVEGGSGLTLTGSIIGTPSYMAPEQAEGNRNIGPAADIYSLGAILYECLTGRPPFRAATAFDTIKQVVTDEPVPPRQLNPQVPRDLETVCLKCLHKEPTRRYRSAADLAAELERYERGEPVMARPVGRLERAWRWGRRHPATAALAVLVVVTLMLGVTISSLFAIRASNKAEEANAQRAQAERETAEALANLQEAEEQRDRARFYLQTYLDLSPIGRSLRSRPLRQDFQIKVKLLAEGHERSRSSIWMGQDSDKLFSVSIQPGRSCYVSVLYIKPEDVIRDEWTFKRYGNERVLLLFPNQQERDQYFERDEWRDILNSRETFIRPVVTARNPAFLYVLATERDWGLRGDRQVGSYFGFSPSALARFRKQIDKVVEHRDGKAGEEGNGVAEEIFFFSVRSR